MFNVTPEQLNSTPVKNVNMSKLINKGTGWIISKQAHQESISQCFIITHEQVSAWVEANFSEFKVRKNGTEYVVNNPFDGDTGYHCNVSCRGVHDWRGDHWAGSYKPTFLRFVQLLRKCSYAQAIKEVCGGSVSLRSIELQLQRQRNQRDEQEEKGDVLLALPEGSQKIIGSSQPKMAEMLIGWLESRGLTKDRIEAYDLYHYADTVVWPYYEYGMLVYWQSRNRLNKVFNFPDESTGLGKTMFFYGFDHIEPNDHVIITEAIFGSHTLEAQALASGGAVLEEKQVRKLRIFNPTRGVILAADNDKAGVGSIPRNYALIKPYYPVFHSIPPKIEYIERGEKLVTKDWNELHTGLGLSLKKIRQIFEERIMKTTMNDISRFTRIIQAT